MPGPRASRLTCEHPLRGCLESQPQICLDGRRWWGGSGSSRGGEAHWLSPCAQRCCRCAPGCAVAPLRSPPRPSASRVSPSGFPFAPSLISLDPKRGRDPPSAPRALPFVGRNRPKRGRCRGKRGRKHPSVGRCRPSRGRGGSKRGRYRPSRGRCLPSLGRSRASRGRNRGKRGKLPPKRGRYPVISGENRGEGPPGLTFQTPDLEIPRIEGLRRRTER